MLRQAEIEEADTDSRLLLDYVHGADYGWYFLHQNDEMPEKERTQFSDLVHQRSRRIPLQYLTGEQDFMGISIKVSPDVLIPRQDTEILAEESIRRIRPGDRVLDLCTGSGCLAVSIARYCPEAQVTASDISEAALSIAAENVRYNQCTVNLIQSDLFEKITGSFDVIVSNPPYIKSEVIGTLAPEVKECEPHLALDGGTDGLDFYRKIVRDSRRHLKENGWLLLEIGFDQGQEVGRLLSGEGFRNTAILKDLAGLDRVAVGRR